MSKSRLSESQKVFQSRFGTENVSGPVLEGDQKSRSGAQLSSMIDFKNLLESVEGKSLSPKVEPGKKTQALQRILCGTFDGGEREPLLCPIEILFLSKSLGDKVLFGPDSRTFLELIREAPEFRLRFSQGTESYLDFFYSELVSADVVKDCVVNFEFKDHTDAEVKELKVKFCIKNQFEQLQRDFGRYLVLLKESNETYEPRVNDITKNLGAGDCPVFGKKPALTWDEKDIEEWLKHVLFQKVKGSDVMSVYEFLKNESLFPKKIGSKKKKKKKKKKETGTVTLTQSTSKNAAFEYFHYENLARFFEKKRGTRRKVKSVNEEEEVEGEEEEEEKERASFRYLDEIFKGKNRNLKRCFSFELSLLDSNTLDGQPYFNYNYHQVLKKIVDNLQSSNTMVHLFDIQDTLLIFQRQLWSVVDCVDHIFSLMFLKMGVEEWVRTKQIEFEGEERGPASVVSRSSSWWDDWTRKLDEFNGRECCRLEELSYNVWVDSKRRNFFEERKKLRGDITKLRKLIKNPSLEEGEKKKLEDERDSKMNRYKEIPRLEKRFTERKKRRMEEIRFLLSESRRKGVQKFLLDVLISNMKLKMFDFGVKTVLSLMPSSKKENFEEMFTGRMTKIGLKLSKFFGKKPSFAKFGFCHSSVTFRNVAIHWFSNSLIMLADLRDKGSLYEEVIAMEAGCPTLCYGHIKSAYDQVLRLAEFIISANVAYEYTLMGSLRDDGKSKKVNCQQVTVRLLKMLNYTKYDEEVKQYLDQFVDKYSEMGALKPKDTKNSRWLPLKNKKFNKRFRGQILVFVKKYNDPNATEIPNQVYFNSRKEVCEFALELMNVEKLFRVQYSGVYQLLKGFDRAFQILGQKVEVCPFMIGGGIVEKTTK